MYISLKLVLPPDSRFLAYLRVIVAELDSYNISKAPKCKMH